MALSDRHYIQSLIKFQVITNSFEVLQDLYIKISNDGRKHDFVNLIKYIHEKQPYMTRELSRYNFMDVSDFVNFFTSRHIISLLESQSFVDHELEYRNVRENYTSCLSFYAPNDIAIYEINKCEEELEKYKSDIVFDLQFFIQKFVPMLNIICEPNSTKILCSPLQMPGYIYCRRMRTIVKNFFFNHWDENLISTAIDDIVNSVSYHVDNQNVFNAVIDDFERISKLVTRGCESDKIFDDILSKYEIKVLSFNFGVDQVKIINLIDDFVSGNYNDNYFSSGVLRSNEGFWIIVKNVVSLSDIGVVEPFLRAVYNKCEGVKRRLKNDEMDEDQFVKFFTDVKIRSHRKLMTDIAVTRRFIDTVIDDIATKNVYNTDHIFHLTGHQGEISKDEYIRLALQFHNQVHEYDRFYLRTIIKKLLSSNMIFEKEVYSFFHMMLSSFYPSDKKEMIKDFFPRNYEEMSDRQKIEEIEKMDDLKFFVMSLLENFDYEFTLKRLDDFLIY